MNGLMSFAQATNTIDVSAVGVSVTSLLGSLGAAGAAVAVTYYFLVFLKDQSEKQNRLFEDFKDYHTESQKKFQDQLDRLSDRQEQSQRGFQEQVTRITEAQNLLLRDAILAMRAVEKSQDRRDRNDSRDREDDCLTPVGGRARLTYWSIARSTRGPRLAQTKGRE